MKRVLFLLITVLAIAITFTSCKKDKEKTYTVTFNSNGGSEVEAQTIAEGANAVEPQPEPTQEGYYFGGWYTNSPALTNKWNFDTDVVTANITLYAKWSTIKLIETITYEHITYGDVKYDRYRFEYDEQNRITKISEHYPDVSLNNTSTFTYAGDDLVQVLHSYSSGDVTTYEYIKSGNTITFTEKYIYNDVDYTNTSTIELDSNGLPVKNEVERSGNVNYFHVYEYQDGNLTTDRITYDTEYDDTETRTYTYDNKKGALYYCQTPKWYLILYLNEFGIKDNVTYDGGTWPPRRNYTYEYDITGFPAKRIRQSSGHMTYSESMNEFIYITK